MNLLRKAKKIIKVIREDGFNTFISNLTSKYRLPITLSSKFRWKAGIKSGNLILG